MLAAIFACLTCAGMSCDQGRGAPGLPAPTFTDIHLVLRDPATAAPGVFLAWSYSGERADYYEIRQSTDRDSLLRGTSDAPVATESLSAVLPLPDSSRPFTVHYGVRAVRVEATGQKLYSDSIRTDSLTVTPGLSILEPAAGRYLQGRILGIQVQTLSDPGVTLRMAYFEKDGRGTSGWSARLDTCLPLEACGRPIFGSTLLRDSVVLDSVSPGDSISSMLCVTGSENFQEQRTGLSQSIACSRFSRVGP